MPLEPTLARIEEEVLAEGREWMRQRLQQKLQERADGSAHPPRGAALGWASKKKLTLESSVGTVEILFPTTDRCPAGEIGFVPSAKPGPSGRIRK